MKLRRSSSGVALVIVLSFVVILTALVVAFFSRSLLNRQVASSSAAQTKVDALAHDALQQIIGDVQQEIAAGSKPETTPPTYTVNNVRVFLPQVNLTAAPASALPSGASAAAIPSLLKQSASTVAFFPSTANYDTQTYPPSNRAVAARTDKPSHNGRYISAARWNKPLLLPRANPATPDDFTPVAAFTPPDWIPVTRAGAGATTTDVKVLRDSTNTNNDYVIGRFAYTIYNEGGLLDVNVAGNQLSADEDAKRGRLVQASLADLRDPVTSAALILDPVTFLKWRASGTGSNSSNVASSGGLFDPKRNFITVQPGDQTFLSREDLINYAKAYPGVLDINGLQYLTTFTRAANAPSYFPPANRPRAVRSPSPTYTDDQLNPAIANVRWPAARVLNDGTSVKAGDPFVRKRFPLSRLALVTHSATATQLESDQIYRYFGLYRSTADAPWQYDHGGGSGRILTLKEVAAAAGAGSGAREEPDFFELLQAGILTGSLGKDGGPVGSATSNYIGSASDTLSHDKNPAVQVMSIGANIIDQYDSDSYPTNIQFQNSVDGSIAQIYGVENLPYLTRVFGVAYRFQENDNGNPAAHRPYIGGWFQPEIWNPHQPKSANSGSGPSMFRFRIVGASRVWAQDVPAAPATGHTDHFGPTDTFPDVDPNDPSLSDAGAGLRTWLPFAITPAQTYAQPKLLQLPNQFTSLAAEDNVNEAGAVFAGVYIKKGYFPEIRETQNVNASSAGLYKYAKPETTLNSYAPNGLSFYLEYLDAGSRKWVTYHRMKQVENNHSNAESTLNKYFEKYGGINDFLARSDPRSDRFGCEAGVPSNYPADTSLRPGAASGYNVDWFNPTSLVYKSGTTRTYGTLSDNLATSDVYYNDSDGVVRGADGYYTTGSGNAGYPLIAGNTESRPIILDRPFRTVGEMGYAFRDAPWKSLDFFSSNSADAALLDLFSIDDNATVGGRVDLNTRQSPVLAAILSGALKTENNASGKLSATDAQTIASRLTTSTASTANGQGPLLNRAELLTRAAARLTSDPATGGAPVTTDDAIIKTRREVAVRALAEAGETRMWNLMIDVIAQSGRYPINASTTTPNPLADQFVVDGERRYWLHVAIDRYTGKVVDQMLEPVYE